MLEKDLTFPQTFSLPIFVPVHAIYKCVDNTIYTFNCLAVCFTIYKNVIVIIIVICTLLYCTKCINTLYNYHFKVELPI